jgi:hypothetical protein
MPTEDLYNLYITDQDRNVILEESSIDARSAEKIIRGYAWHNRPQSYAQFWKPNTKFSLSIHFVASGQKFQVGFSDKASRLKLPLPYVGATYGLLSGMDQIIASLHLFLDGKFQQLEQFLAEFRLEQKGDDTL